MGVRWQTRPVQLEGLDAKSDPKNVLDGKLLTLENGVWERPGAINKRSDIHTQLGGATPVYSVLTGYSSRYSMIKPDTTDLAACKGLFKFRDRLVHLNGTRLRTSEDGSFWVDRGPLTPMRAQVERDILPDLYRSGAAFERVYVDCGYQTANDIYVVAGFVPAVGSTTYRHLRIAVFQGVGGPLLQQYDHPSDSELLANTLRVVVVSTAVHVYHQDDAALHVSIVDTANPTTTPTHAVVVASGMNDAAVRGEFDVCKSLSQYHAYAVYRTSGSPNTVSAIVVDVSGTVVDGPDILYNAGATVGAYLAIRATAANQYFIAYTVGAAGYARALSSTLSPLFAAVQIAGAASTASIWIVESTTANTCLVASQAGRDIHIQEISNAGVTSYPNGMVIYGAGYLCTRPWYVGDSLMFGVAHIKPSTPSSWDPCVSLFQFDYDNSDLLDDTQVTIQARFLESAVLDAEPMASNVVPYDSKYHLVLPGLFASGGLDEPLPGVCRVVLDLTNPVPRATEFGNALLITGGQLWEYGGEYLVEAQPRNTPQSAGGDISVGFGGAGSTIPDGDYQVAQVLVWKSSNGRLYKSGPTSIKSVTVTGGVASYVRVAASIPVAVGHRKDGELRVVTYMSEKDGSVLFEVDNSIKSAEDSGPGGYNTDIAALPSGDEPVLYTTGGIYPHFPAPAPWNVCARGNRLFAACNDGNVHFTKELVDGEAAAQFCTEYVKVRPGANNEPFYVAEMGGNVFAFHKTGIAAFGGPGPNDAGQGAFTDFQEIAVDVPGISDYTLAVPAQTNAGLFFWTNRGPMLLNRQLQVEPVGLPIETEVANLDCLDTVPLPLRYQIWFLTSTKVFVFDYLLRRWSIFPLTYTAVGMVEIDNVVHIAADDGKVYKELAGTFKSTDVLKFRTGWIRPENYIGEFRARKMLLLGTKKSAATITVRVYFDYNDTVVETHTLDIDTPWASEPAELVVPLSHQRCQAVSFEVYDGGLSGTNEGITVSGMYLEIGLMPNRIVKVPSSKITS